jgi:hypothetical protein
VRVEVVVIDEALDGALCSTLVAEQEGAALAPALAAPRQLSQPGTPELG